MTFQSQTIHESRATSVSAGEPVPDELEDWKKRELQSSRFFHSTVPSQDKHATPMGLVAELSDEDDVNTVVKIGQHEPNGLLYTYLCYPLGLAIKLAEFSGGKGFKDKLAKVRKALEVYRATSKHNEAFCELARSDD